MGALVRPVLRALLIGAAAALLSVAAASAHAHYDHSTPGIGQVMASAPSSVDIYTDSDMAKVAGADTIVVTDSAGKNVTVGAAAVDDANRRHFSVALQPNLAPGRYLVAFTTLSDVDGDTDAGRFSFYVGSGSTAAERKLDVQLTSAPSVGSGSSGSHTATVVVIAAAVFVVVVVAGGAIFVHSRRHSAA